MRLAPRFAAAMTVLVLTAAGCGGAATEYREVPGGPVVLEVDDVDDEHRSGWSVLARGELEDLEPDEAVVLGARADPDTWLGQSAVLARVLVLTSLSGRELVESLEVWSPRSSP